MAGIEKLSAILHPKERTLHENTNNPNTKSKLNSSLEDVGGGVGIITVDRWPWSCLATIFANTFFKKGTVCISSCASLGPVL